MPSRNSREFVGLVGIIAFVVSLILPGYEIRQYTLAVLATAIQDATLG